jgi:hypothetical protein
MLPASPCSRPESIGSTTPASILCTPFPVSALEAGLPEGGTNNKTADLPPAEVGLKATLTVQVPPLGRTLVEQVSSVMTNSASESVVMKGPEVTSPGQLGE